AGVDVLGAPPITIVVAGALSAAVVFAFGWVMPARTAAGTQALEGVLGFEEFLARVESDRIARVEKTPEMFEKFLPFAMALGVEHQWARAFEGICQKIGRASCRERVEIWGVGVSTKEKARE